MRMLDEPESTHAQVAGGCMAAYSHASRWQRHLRAMDTSFLRVSLRSQETLFARTFFTTLPPETIAGQRARA
eukprot:652543-Pleurochrysis_carterae.AAC.1